MLQLSHTMQQPPASNLTNRFLCTSASVGRSKCLLWACALPDNTYSPSTYENEACNERLLVVHMHCLFLYEVSPTGPVWSSRILQSTQRLQRSLQGHHAKGRSEGRRQVCQSVPDRSAFAGCGSASLETPSAIPSGHSHVKNRSTSEDVFCKAACKAATSSCPVPITQVVRVLWLLSKAGGSSRSIMRMLQLTV